MGRVALRAHEPYFRENPTLRWGCKLTFEGVPRLRGDRPIKGRLKNGPARRARSLPLIGRQTWHDDPARCTPSAMSGCKQQQ